MAGRGRQVADAYIDVHGDLKSFRDDLKKNKPSIEAAGEDLGKDFSEGFDKSAGPGINKSIDKIFDMREGGSKNDWGKVFGSFDNKDLNGQIAESIDFITRMRNEGTLTREEFRNMSNEATKMGKKFQNNAEWSKALRSDWNGLRNSGMSLSNMVKKTGGIFSGMGRAVSGAGAAMKKGWKGMDDDVRLVVGLIAAGAGPIAAGLSGISAGVTAIASSAAMSVAAVIPLATAFVGLGVGVALAISSFEGMKKQFPAINAGLKSIGKTWDRQAKSFGNAWGPELGRFLGAFSKQLGSVNFGKTLGGSFAQITKAFTGVVNGSGFTAFMQAFKKDIPDAVTGIGTGFAGMTDALVNLLAGAAPVAAKLGDDFAKWGTALGKSMEEARKSGKMNEIFEKARESLLAVLDLTGSLGSALGTVFNAGADSGNRMLTELAGIVDKWNEWMNTTEGQNALAEWFANGERIMKSFKPVLVGLAEALDTLVTPRSISMFEDLMKSVGDFLPMLGQMLQVVSNLGIFNILFEALNAIGQAIAPLLPSLRDMAALLGETVRGAIEQLSPLFAALGEALAPILATIFDLASRVLPVLVDAFARIVPIITPIIKVLGQVVAFIIDFLAPILGDLLIGMINNVVGVFQGLGRVIEGVIQFIQGIFNVFVGVFTGDMERIKEGAGQIWEGIKDIFLGAVEAIWNFVQLWLVGKVFGAIKGFLNPLTGLFNKSLTGVANVVSKIFGAIAKFVRAIWNGIAGFFRTMFRDIVDLFKATWNGILNIVTSIFKNLAKGISSTGKGISNAWNAMWNGIMTFFRNIWNRIKEIASQTWDELLGFFDDMIRNLKNVGKNGLNSIRDTWNNIWNGISNFVRGIWDNVSKTIGDAIGRVKNTIGNTLQNILANWHRVWNDAIGKIKSVFGDVMRNVGNFVRDLRDRIYNGARDAVNRAKDGISSMPRVFWDAIRNVASSIGNAFSWVRVAVINGINSFMGKIRDIPTLAWNALVNVGSKLYPLGKNLLEGFIRGVKAKGQRLINSVMGPVKDAVNNVKNFLGIRSPSRLFRSFGQFMGEGMALGAKDERRNVADAASSMAAAAVSGLSVSKMLIAGKDAASGFAQGLKDNKGLVDGALGDLSAVDSPTASVTASLSRRAALDSQNAESQNVGGKVFAEGAIQVVTPAQDGRVVAAELLDELVRNGG